MICYLCLLNKLHGQVVDYKQIAEYLSIIVDGPYTLSKKCLRIINNKKQQSTKRELETERKENMSIRFIRYEEDPKNLVQHPSNFSRELTLRFDKYK